MDPLSSSAAWPSPAYPPPPPLFPQPPISAAPEPPYHDMIIAAITTLKEREGSSRQAIDKYIQSVYTGNLPSNHPTLLTYHLKKMKNEGALAMVKHSYSLPGTVPAPTDFPSPPPSSSKRGRGRPPKPKTPSVPTSEPAVVPFPSPDSNQPNAETMLVSLGLVDGPLSSKRGRGRPKLLKTGPDGEPVNRLETSPKPVSEKKPRGRPPRLVRDVVRPPRLADQQQMGASGSKGRGRPPKKVATPGSKQRGRPRKFPVAGGGGGVLTVVGVKRGRGRPPKAGGIMKKLRRYSGKPIGRPRKNAISPATQLAAQNLVAYQDLANKLVHFQSRVKHAVDLVRPYFTSEAAPYVYGALQELEVLANTDMTAPPQQLLPEAQPQQSPASGAQGFENP